MSTPIGRRATTILCAAAVLAPLALPVHGAVGDDTDTAITIDQTIQSLKDELVLFQRDATLAEDQYLYPAFSRVTVFLSNEIPGLLLKELSVSIDGQPPVVHQYDEVASRALLREASTQRLLRINLPRGQHSVRAQFTGQMVQAKEGDDPISAHGEFNFQKDVEPTELELRITKGSRRRSSPAMQIREWKAVQ